MGSKQCLSYWWIYVKTLRITASDFLFSTLELCPILPWPSSRSFFALIHDAEFSIDKTKAGIANILNNKTIAEQHSVVVAWELLRSLDSPTCKHAFSPLNPIANASDS